MVRIMSKLASTSAQSLSNQSKGIPSPTTVQNQTKSTSTLGSPTPVSQNSAPPLPWWESPLIFAALISAFITVLGTIYNTRKQLSFSENTRIKQEQFEAEMLAKQQEFQKDQERYKAQIEAELLAKQQEFQKDQERYKVQLQNHYGHLDEKVKALRYFSEKIQSIRDILNNIAEDEHQSMDSETAREKLSSAINELTVSYQTHHSLFENIQSGLMHDIKKISNSILKINYLHPKYRPIKKTKYKNSVKVLRIDRKKFKIY
jgi:chromosome segregation ATPase